MEAKKLKDIDPNELRNFLRKMVWFKATGRGDLRETNKEFWGDLVAPEIDDIFTIASYNIKNHPEEEITEDGLTVYIALAIAIALEVRRQMRNGEDLDFWNEVSNPDLVLQQCEKNPKFQEKVRFIGQEIAPDIISWIQNQKYINEVKNSKIKYSELEEFIKELMEVKKTKEPEKWKVVISDALESLDLCLNLVARRARLEEKEEESEPEFFIASILKNLTLGSIAKRSVETIRERIGIDPLDGTREREFYKESYKDSLDYFVYLKKLLGPGLVWWVKENFSNHPEVNLEDIIEVFDDYSENGLELRTV